MYRIILRVEGTNPPSNLCDWWLLNLKSQSRPRGCMNKLIRLLYPFVCVCGKHFHGNSKQDERYGKNIKRFHSLPTYIQKVLYPEEIIFVSLQNGIFIPGHACRFGSIFII